VRPPLSVLDLVPITSGSTARDALLCSIDLARRTERAGYRRYWIAEHHLNPGVAGTAPAVVMSVIANATSTIRVGSGAVQMGHHTPLSVVEQFGLLDAAYPGRIDLGLGRSGFRRGARTPFTGGEPKAPHRTERGVLIPSPFSLAPLLRSPRFKLQGKLIQQPGAETPPYGEQVDDVLRLIAGTYCDTAGTVAHIVPGEGADVEVWIVGSSGGESATVAGVHALPFAANYHVAPAGVLEAVDAYRTSFQPSPERSRPYVAVSVDVVVAPSDEEARELSSGYGLWVRSIRTASGAIPFPTPAEAAQHDWSDEDRELVADRVDTQFVGSPTTVVDQLEALADETGADELILTTITHDHHDRVRSYELIAEAWGHDRRQVTALSA
jgi:alkanesulfonate monooxygenase SsuD/methylene tetrahydromethanopterin reductase-like flavin-dependent oxidoreductase (luciferase family)